MQKGNLVPYLRSTCLEGYRRAKEQWGLKQLHTMLIMALLERVKIGKRMLQRKSHGLVSRQ